jgi:hypothetical protein
VNRYNYVNYPDHHHFRHSTATTAATTHEYVVCKFVKMIIKCAQGVKLPVISFEEKPRTQIVACMNRGDILHIGLILVKACDDRAQYDQFSATSLTDKTFVAATTKLHHPLSLPKIYISAAEAENSHFSSARFKVPEGDGIALTNICSNAQNVECSISLKVLNIPFLI